MSISLTESAAGHVKKFAAGKNQIPSLRLSVKTTGCSGYMYEVELSEDTHDNDKIFESHGVKLIIDDQSYPYVAGTQIDFTREGLNEGFKFENPNVAACSSAKSKTKPVAGCLLSWSRQSWRPRRRPAPQQTQIKN